MQRGWLVAEVCKRKLIHGDCLDVLPTLREGRVDAVVTDPPYGLEFMGKEWDKLTRNCMNPQSEADQQWNESHTTKDTPGTKDGLARRLRNLPDIGGSLKYGAEMQEWWHRHFSAVLRVLKPGGYALIFGGTRTYHRLACAVEDAGFELRDCIMWLYATGFPKGQGNLKPAYEPILLARKPGPKVLPLGIDEARVPTSDRRAYPNGPGGKSMHYSDQNSRGSEVRPHPWEMPPAGRYPANICHDGSDEVLEAFAAFGERGASGQVKRQAAHVSTSRRPFAGVEQDFPFYADSGTAARFFMCAKASRRERGEGNTHTTVKPLTLIRWLVRLACPAGGTVLDPFLGSGTTMVAAIMEDRHSIGIEREAEYVEIARNRVVKAERNRRDRLV